MGPRATPEMKPDPYPFDARNPILSPSPARVRLGCFFIERLGIVFEELRVSSAHIVGLGFGPWW